MSQESTFWRVCDNFGICHCDWRYTIYDCEETEIAKILYLITAIISGILSVVAVMILYFRLNYRNQKIFEIRNGFPRPKPIESMGLFGIIFNVLQMIHAIFMLTDIIPSPVFRSFLFDFPFQFGYCCFACYLFGVAYTLSESSRIIYSTWVKSHTMVNILCLITMTFPFMTNTACAVAAGIYAARGDNAMASKLTMAQYYFWGLYCGYLGSLLLFAGVRLIRLLDKHLLMQSDMRININKVKTGALKVKIIVLVGTSCLWIFAFLVILYTICRDAVMTNQGSNMVVAAVWLFAGPIATFFVEIAVLINPAIAAQLSNLSFGQSSSDSRNDLNLSKKQTSFELGFSKSKNSRASQFVTSTITSPLDEDARFSFDEIKKPHESIDALVLHDGGNTTKNLTPVEEEQAAYNATINRVRTPPPFHPTNSTITTSSATTTVLSSSSMNK